MLETKDRLNKSVESNFNVKHKRFSEGKYPELDQKLYDWFLRMRSNSVELTGDLLLEQARIIATELEIENFTGSHGYLEKFRNRFNIHFKKLHVI